MCDDVRLAVHVRGIADTGATHNMTSDLSLFRGYVRKANIVVSGISTKRGGAMRATGRGRGVIKIGGIEMPLKVLYYVPGLRRTLVSVSTVALDGWCTRTDRRGMWVHHEDDPSNEALVPCVQGLYQLPHGTGKNVAMWECEVEPARLPVMGFVAQAQAEESPGIGVRKRATKYLANTYTGGMQLADLLHKRCAHILLKHGNTSKAMKEAFGKAFKPEESCFCSSCVKYKMTQRMCHESARRHATRPLQYVHFDVSPNVPVDGPAGQTGFALFVDEYSGYWKVYFIKRKAELIECLQRFKTMAEKHFRTTLGSYSFPYEMATLRSDQAGENTSAAVREWLNKEGIVHETSAPYHQYQNGLVERAMRTVWEGAEAIRDAAGLPARFWCYAVETVVYVHNHMPPGNASKCGGKSPYEVWHDVVIPLRTRLRHLRVFGSRAFMLIPKAERKKLECKARECMMLGYSNDSRNYRLMELTTGKVFVSPSVVFDETSLPCRELKEQGGGRRDGTDDDDDVCLSTVLQDFRSRKTPVIQPEDNEDGMQVRPDIPSGQVIQEAEGTDARVEGIPDAPMIHGEQAIDDRSGQGLRDRLDEEHASIPNLEPAAPVTETRLAHDEDQLGMSIPLVPIDEE